MRAQEDPTALLTRADALLANGDQEGALRLYREARSLSLGTPTADAALLRIAQVYLEMGRPSSAVVTLYPALAWMPAQPQHRAHFLLAEAHRSLGNCRLALPYYRRYVRDGTVLEDLIAERMAGCYRDLGDHARAAEEFTRAAGSYRSLSDQVGMLEQAAEELRAAGSYDQALERLERILSIARIPWYRAKILYREGEVLEAAGRPQEAQARWQEALSSYPDTFSASWAADALLAAGVGVNPYDVARAYRAASRLEESLSWFEEALLQGAGPTADLRYALAAVRAESGDLEGALDEMDALFRQFPNDPSPLLRKGRILAGAGEIERALKAYDRVVQGFPANWAAGEALWRSGQLLEEQGRDEEALAAYSTLLEGYAGHEEAADARFHAGMLLYRKGRFQEAVALWAEESGEAATRAALWSGLALARTGRVEEARQAWQKAAAGEGYYAARARERLSTAEEFGEWHRQPALGTPPGERARAEGWLARYWGQPVSAMLPPSVQADPLFVRGQELLALGQDDQAGKPFSLLIQRYQYDGPALYALALYLRQQQLHSLSIRCAERIVEMAAEREKDAPPFILRLLYPAPYADLVLPESEANGVDPLLFFAMVRQESFFDRYATSWVEARGLTQVIPSTGEGIASALGVSPFAAEDLYRPVISIRFGAWYLGQQEQMFQGQAIPALAAYNGGPGNALRWAGQATPVPDLDLFMEAVDYTETRDYIERIYTYYWVYRRLYASVVHE